MLKPWILKEQDLSRTFEIWLWVSQIEFYSPFGNLTFQGRAVKLLGRRLPTQLNHFYTRSNHPVRQWLGCTITSFPKYLGSITHSQFRWARIPRDKMFDESWWGEIPLFFRLTHRDMIFPTCQGSSHSTNIASAKISLGIKNHACCISYYTPWMHQTTWKSPILY